ncbi:MAG: AAA family ATPase, partial [Psychrosphaera sp.]|nr:AAA family ATPase [Psychrosphaera sp.]
MQLPQKYPLGIQTFSEIREEQYLYVDKTALVYDLVTTGKAYFLSRPRRFGKSLLVSTLEALFAGQKSLFEGLDIADTDYDFVEYPVIKLEFSSVDVNQA